MPETQAGLTPQDITAGDWFAAKREHGEEPDLVALAVAHRALTRKGEVHDDLDTWLDGLPLGDVQPLLRAVNQAFDQAGEGEATDPK